MDSHAAFDAWLADTPFTAVADTIYERFNKSIALEECLDTVDPENPTLAYEIPSLSLDWHCHIGGFQGPFYMT